MLTSLLFSEVSVVSGFLNDNYTGSTENGENGDYIGADDFLTYSMFVKSTMDNLSISEYYQLVTSRKYEYRYDLLETDVEYLFEVGGFILKPQLMFIFKGDYYGEEIQNAIHEYRDLPLVYLDYTDSDFALGIGGIFEYELNPFIFRLDLELPYDIKPISTTLSIDGYYNFKYVDIDILAGYKQYLNSVDEYSDFVESGFIGGVQAVIKPYKSYTISAGCFFFPADNLENDDAYEDIDHSYSPQFWISVGLNGGLYNILDIVNF